VPGRFIAKQELSTWPIFGILAKLTKEKYEQVTVMYEEFKDKALVAFEHNEQFHASP